LLARIKAILRRIQFTLETRIAENKLPQIHFANWILDQQNRCLINDKKLKIPLSKGEYDLLLVFLEHPSHILTRDHLLDLTRGKEFLAFDRSIDVQVGRLRKKLEVDPKDPQIIVTVRNTGYQFIPEIKYQTP
jgi:two-component system OmpR family response regulator